MNIVDRQWSLCLGRGARPAARSSPRLRIDPGNQLGCAVKDNIALVASPKVACPSTPPRCLARG